MRDKLIRMQVQGSRSAATISGKAGMSPALLRSNIGIATIVMSLLAPAMASAAACGKVSDGTTGVTGLIDRFTGTVRALAGPVGLLVMTVGGLAIAFAFKSDFVSKGRGFIKNAIMGIAVIAIAGPVLGWIVSIAGVAADTESTCVNIPNATK